MADITIRRNDRAFFVGSTGSGKTTLAKSLLWNRPYIVVLDPKRTFTLPASWPKEQETFTSVNQASDIYDDRTIIYRPGYDELQDRCDSFFQWIFERENTLLYVDEVQSVTRNNRMGYWYGRCIQEGREKGIGIWSATQRPATIPLITMTESQHMFVFHLSNPDDRKRMGDYGTNELRKEVKHRHGFYYLDVNKGRVRYYPKANVGKLV